MPLPGIETDKTGLDSIGDVDAAGVFLIRSRDHQYRRSQAPIFGLDGFALGWLRPPVFSGTSGPPPLASADFGDFRRYVYHP